MASTIPDFMLKDMPMCKPAFCHTSPITIQAIQSGHWQDTLIWSNGQLPTIEDDIVIPDSITVLMSGNMTAHTIEVKGTLRAPSIDSINIQLYTKAIHVLHNGLLEIGTTDMPYIGKCTITLIGDNPDEIICPSMGTKFIGAMPGGTIRMHGQSQVAWAKLTGNVPVNSNEIKLNRVVNWSVGDEIVIAASRQNWKETELRTITYVHPDQQTITLNQAVQFPHTGIQKNYTRTSDGKTWEVDLRAEVGLLSRNITIQGDSTSIENGFGGHIMIHHAAYGYMDNIALRQMGQKGKLGRYPFHWHMTAEHGQGQYFKNSSVYQSFNRAITIHGTESTLVTDNVFYDHIGHGVFLEDGSERFNTISNNLVIGSRRPLRGEEVTPSDNQLNEVQNRTPASFWITNPNNFIENNVAAGTEGTGFWLIFPKTSLGASGRHPRFQSLEPYKEPLGRFYGNKAHSCTNGFDVFDQLDTMHSIVVGGGWENATTHLIDSCTWYANQLAIYAGIGEEGFQDNVIYHNNIFIDNKTHAMLATYNIIDNALVVADSEEDLIEGQRYFYRVYDGAGQVRNTHFVGWNKEHTNFLLNGGADTKHVNHQFSGITTDHNNRVTIKLPNAQQVAINAGTDDPSHPRTWSVVVADKDGTLSGKANSSIVGNHPFLLLGDEDKYPNWHNAYRSNHHFAMSILSYDMPEELYPNITVHRSKEGTPDASVYYVNGLKEHHQLPLIVNEDFLYTYEYESLPKPKMIKLNMDDAQKGDHYMLRFKHFGKLGNLRIQSSEISIEAFNSLSALKSAETSGYFIEGNGDLYIRPIAQYRRQNIEIQWDTNMNLEPLDSDGDGASDGWEASQGLNPFDAEDLLQTFDWENNYEHWTLYRNILDLRIANKSLSGKSNNIGDANMENNSFYFDAKNISMFYVWMKASENGLVQLFWKRNIDDRFSADRVVSAYYAGNGQWQKIYFDVQDFSNWNGIITGLRLDPVTASDVHFQIDEIGSAIDMDGDGISNKIENKSCRISESPQDCRFDFNQSTETFILHDIDISNTTNESFWLIRSDYREDPFIVRNHLDLDGSQISSLHAKVKSEATGVFQLFWAVRGADYFSPERVLTIPYNRAKQWEEIVFNLANHPQWLDHHITKLRLDFPSKPEASVHYWIDELYHPNENTTLDLAQYIQVNSDRQEREAIQLCYDDEVILDMDISDTSDWNFNYYEPNGNLWTTNIPNQAQFTMEQQFVGDWVIQYANPLGCQTIDTFHIALFTLDDNQNGIPDNCEIEIDYCTMNGDFPYHEWISGVFINTINHTSGKDGYADNTHLITDLAKNQSHNIFLANQFSWSTYNQYWKIWIDYNQNGRFEEPDELALAHKELAPPNGTTNHFIQNQIQIPRHAKLGATRISYAERFICFAMRKYSFW